MTRKKKSYHANLIINEVRCINKHMESGGDLDVDFLRGNFKRCHPRGKAFLRMQKLWTKPHSILISAAREVAINAALS